MNSVLQTLKHILTEPSDFFHNIKSRKGIKKPFYFLIFLTLFTMMFLTYYYIDALNNIFLSFYEAFGIREGFRIEFSAAIYLIVYFSLGIIFILTFFLRSWLTHFWICVFKGKNKVRKEQKCSYDRTYSAMSYASAPDYIAAPFFVALFFLYQPAFGKGVILFLILFFICAIVFVSASGYQIYIKTTALSKMQDLSKTKAFIAVYVLGVISYFLVILLIEIILLACLYLAYYYLFL